MVGVAPAADEAVSLPAAATTVTLYVGVTLAAVALASLLDSLLLVLLTAVVRRGS